MPPFFSSSLFLQLSTAYKCHKAFTFCASLAQWELALAMSEVGYGH